MNPVEPRPPIAPGWSAVTYAKDQPEYLALPAARGPIPETPVVSVWELTDEEILLMQHAMLEWLHNSTMPRPKISLMLLTFGQPLQPIRLVVGEFPEPYSIPAPADAGNAPLA